ncbi:MAG TPA: adenylate/guanylate cyclase domain-containing protein [Candidatus Binataceae bacterium]|nr:adenylate/guanylate cyclase domain-containing protein [Candidatus Binataceae bacterium]
MTALFADLKGSTALMEDLDPEAAHAIVAPALRIMSEAVRRYEGYVARSTGDGIFALFGAPAAYEDHPQRALNAALAMQQELRAEGERRAAKGLQSLDARVGVHTGEVVAYSVETGGKVESRLVGHTANLAARLEAIAPAGSIAVSDYTRRLCEGYFELRGLGPMTVKGLSAPIEVYEVLGLGPLRSHFQLSARRGLTRFIGREHELAQMQRALELAIAGQGQVVTVMAEAGTGKSRLFHEFKATIPATCKVLEAYSVSHGKASAWLPMLELLRNYFGIQDTDDAAARREKVRNAQTELDLALTDTLPYLFGLLGVVEGADPLAQMDPQIKRQRTLEAIKRIILRENLNQPVVLIFEDLHWVDAQTQALLDLLADSVARANVLLLVNYRPEYHHEWTNKSYYSQLRLEPLGGADGAAMLAALLGEAVELNPLKRLITERTGGNPFFIEEIVQALFEDGALARNGVVKVTRSLSQLRLPPTVQGMLASRIDRQPSEHKQLLQTLAVIGRESSRALLRQVASHADTQLERILADLQAGEFIYEQPAATDVEYVFKHALTQEVAYNSLLIERRKQVHERAGHAVESLFAGQLDDHLTQLAHHYSHSDNIDKAIEYLGRAGQQAIKRSANAEAIENISSAIELLHALPDSPERDRQELRIQLALGPALIAIKSWAAPEVERVFIRARQLCEKLRESQQLFATLFGLYAVYLVRGRFRMASELANELLRRAQDANDPTLLMLGNLAAGDTLFEMGEFSQSLRHLEAGIALYIPEQHRAFAFSFIGLDIKVNCLSYAASNLWHLGYPEQARRYSDAAVAWGQELAHPHSQAFAQGLAGNMGKLRGEIPVVRRGAEKLVALSAEHGFALWSAQATVLLGWAMVQQGQAARGIGLTREGLATFRTTGADIGRPYFLSLLVEACIKTKCFEEGLTVLEEAQKLANQNENRSHDAELLRLRGELLLERDDSSIADAGNCFERAVKIARSQGAKSPELRATTSLARLLANQGRRDEARAMLAGIYNWFTEGFDTADLKDAKALLDELN